MKISKSRLIEIIKEEIVRVNEISGLGTALGGAKRKGYVSPKQKKTKTDVTTKTAATKAADIDYKAADTAYKGKQSAYAAKDTVYTTKATAYTAKAGEKTTADTAYKTKASDYNVKKATYDTRTTAYNKKVAAEPAKTIQTTTKQYYNPADKQQTGGFVTTVPSEPRYWQGNPTKGAATTYGIGTLKDYQKARSTWANLSPTKVPVGAKPSEKNVTTTSANPAWSTWEGEKNTAKSAMDSAKALSDTAKTAMDTAKTAYDTRKSEYDVKAREKAAALADREAAERERASAETAKRTKYQTYLTQQARKAAALADLDIAKAQDLMKTVPKIKPPAVGAGYSAFGRGKTAGTGKATTKGRGTGKGRAKGRGRGKKAKEKK